jgi:Flp pilus assembly protein TadG
MKKVVQMRYCKQKQQGLAVVEFAIILPLIVLIALAVTELGRGLYQYNTLTKAVRDGARYLSDVAIGPLGTVDISPYITSTQNLVVYGDVDGGSTPVLRGLSTGDVSVNTLAVTLPGGGITTNHIQVSANFTFVPLFPALSALGYSMVPSMTASTIQRALTL